MNARPPLPEHVGRHLFNVSMQALEASLANAAGLLTPIPEETLERLARDYAAIVRDNALAAAAREKGLAMVELLSAAAEFKRAARRYAIAVIAQGAPP